MNTSIDIKNPCFEDWNKMEKREKGRFCNACQKEVIDFRKMSKKEVLSYFVEHKNQRTCGRFYAMQLKSFNADFNVIIRPKYKPAPIYRFPLYLFGFSALFLNACNTNTSVQKPIEIAQPTVDSVVSTPVDTTIDYHTEKCKVIDTSPVPPLSPAPPLPPEIAGIIVYEPVTPPQFKEGEDSLMSYLQAHINYPKWEQEQGITGKVYVQFVVDKKGEIKNIEIVRTVEKAKNFDKEVIRVVKSMPKWIPAKSFEGEIIEEKIVLPIIFQL